MIHLESLLVIQSVPGKFLLNRLDWNLKSVGQPLKVRRGSELPGKAASCISLTVLFHHM